jgi:ribosomal protein S18 acetylase RimI-like enzyme
MKIRKATNDDYDRLKVYAVNEGAVGFYEEEGFIPLSIQYEQRLDGSSGNPGRAGR